MTHTYDVLGLGNAILDIITPVGEDFLTAYAMDKGAMALIEEPRALDLTRALTALGDVREIAGGSAANTMVGIAGLDVRAGYLGKIGRDRVGETLTQGYRDANVDFLTTPTDSGTASARCMIAVTPDGERTMNTYLGANAEFGLADINAEIIKSAATIYMEGYLFDRDTQKAAFVRAAELAHAAGRQVALTLSDSFCVGRHRASFRQLAETQVDLLFANTDELLALYEVDSLDTALDALMHKGCTVCVTRGAQGSIIQTPVTETAQGRRYLVPAAPITRLIDTTGAGDQYAAGVLAGRARGLDWAQAGYLGSLAAAEVIGHYGARPEQKIDIGAALARGED